MADQINVTDSRSRSPWPWIFGVIVLAILVWAIFQMGDGAGDTTEVQIEVPAATAPAGDTGGDAGAGNETAPPQQ